MNFLDEHECQFSFCHGYKLIKVLLSLELCSVNSKGQYSKFDKIENNLRVEIHNE